MKYLRSLERKKQRRELGVFVAEGPKTVSDMLGSYRCRYVGATSEWLSQHAGVLSSEVEVDELSVDELSKASFLEHPQQVIAVFDIPEFTLDPHLPERELVLALDGVQNPGNLGTIIRIADWFGISDIICSHGSADAFNPKTVQAAMGSLARVRVHYLDLPDFISALSPDVPVYGTFLDGKNIYDTELKGNGVIVMGNEGNGISDNVSTLITQRITIPNFNTSTSRADSLNVAVATAIVCSEFRRAKT